MIPIITPTNQRSRRRMPSQGGSRSGAREHPPARDGQCGLRLQWILSRRGRVAPHGRRRDGGRRRVDGHLRIGRARGQRRSGRSRFLVPEGHRGDREHRRRAPPAGRRSPAAQSRTRSHRRRTRRRRRRSGTEPVRHRRNPRPWPRSHPRTSRRSAGPRDTREADRRLDSGAYRPTPSASTVTGPARPARLRASSAAPSPWSASRGG